MNKINKIILTLIAILGVSLSNDVTNIKGNELSTLAKLSFDSVNVDKKIKNIILFIGDGMGVAHVEATNRYLDNDLSFETFPYSGYVNSDSLSSNGFTLDTTKSLIRPEENKSLYDGLPSPYSPSGSTVNTNGVSNCYTDSAAGGTALATGFKVTNSRIAIDITGKEITNIREIAASLGKKTGVISSDTIVGATPSSFVAHAESRHLKEEIITDIAKSDVDLYIAEMDSEYQNNKNKYESLFKGNGFDISYSRDTLIKKDNKLISILPGVANRIDERVPSLAELTSFSLDYLDNKDGFFLMVEGADIDKKSHSQQSALMIEEMIGLNDAVNEAINFAKNRDDTIIIVTADHETGGLYFDRENATKDTIINDLKWLTYNHSRSRVPLYIYGDISSFTSNFNENFSLLEGKPYWDNTDVFRLCSIYMNG